MSWNYKACVAAFAEWGAAGVFELARAHGVPDNQWAPCPPCESGTPSVLHNERFVCAVCGEARPRFVPRDFVTPAERLKG